MITPNDNFNNDFNDNSMITHNDKPNGNSFETNDNIYLKKIYDCKFIHIQCKIQFGFTAK